MIFSQKIANNIKLFPLDQSQAILNEQFKGRYVIVNSFLKINKQGQHVSRGLKVNELIFNHKLSVIHVIIKVFIEEEFDDF